MSRAGLVVVIVVALAIGAAGMYGYMSRGAHATHEATKYTCPMHPEIIRDKPGQCPICGMDLVPMQPEHDRQTVAKDVATKYTCPMHPQIIRDKPGQCPICGMDLVPMKEEAGAEVTGSEGLEDRAAIHVDSRRRQLIGVKTEPASFRPLTKTIRTVGMVMPDEERISHVHTKVAGWIEKLYVDFVGQDVAKGEPLAAIYSPELVQTQEEYLLALRGRERLKDSPFESARTGSQALVASTRRRLELFDIPAADIKKIEQGGEPKRTMTLYSPVSGYVMDKKVLDGMYVQPGTEMYTITDLSRVWVEADIYEYELPFVRVGQNAALALSYIPGRKYKGKIAYIYPTVEEKTRTVKARFEFSNPGLELKPGMYADVEIDTGGGSALLIPESALIDTGVRQIVFVEEGEGYFVPREVQIGRRSDQMVEIISGLREGDMVVTSGSFLIDSESQLRAATAKAAGSGDGQTGH
jgi:Cu(I)/Ag(I) efflux system membrane fusion protein